MSDKVEQQVDKAIQTLIDCGLVEEIVRDNKVYYQLTSLGEKLADSIGRDKVFN